MSEMIRSVPGAVFIGSGKMVCSHNRFCIDALIKNGTKMSFSNILLKGKALMIFFFSAGLNAVSCSLSFSVIKPT